MEDRKGCPLPSQAELPNASYPIPRPVTCHVPTQVLRPCYLPIIHIGCSCAWQGTRVTGALHTPPRTHCTVGATDCDCPLRLEFPEVRAVCVPTQNKAVESNRLGTIGQALVLPSLLSPEVLCRPPCLELPCRGASPPEGPVPTEREAQGPQQLAPPGLLLWERCVTVTATGFR